MHDHEACVVWSSLEYLRNDPTQRHVVQETDVSLLDSEFWAFSPVQRYGAKPRSVPKFGRSPDSGTA